MLKYLWVMRHGLAEANFQSDFSRELSEIGAKQAKDVATQIKTDGLVQPVNMLVSPFVRTQSTARTVHSTLAMDSQFQTDDMLVHYADHRILGEYLLNCNFEHLILVSHMPIVVYLCRYLCRDFKVNSFQTAQTVRLDFLEQKSISSRVEVNHSKTYFTKY